MLEFTRQNPIGKKETFEAMRAYSNWLRKSRRIPKLFIRAEPGRLLPSGRPKTRFALSFPNQKTVTVKGRHFIQEEAPDEIGQALAAWLAGLK